ncbi:MAG: hypothetical protein R3325_00590 [Thermoanaerobaculia bacterium]|nr:hypothetical protein [Thermoanaerobaculia bacterium]
MTPFALGFMTVSMVAVTALAGFCLLRIVREPEDPPGDDDV